MLLNDELKTYLGIAILAILAHIGTFYREWIMGYDPYFWLTPGRAAAAGYPQLFTFIAERAFEHPWVTAISFTAVIAGLTYHLAKNVNAKRPWLAAVLLFSAPQFIYRMALIEEDLLGVALALAMLVVFLKRRRDATIVLGALSLLSWRGSFVYVSSIAINWVRARANWVIYAIPVAVAIYFGFPIVTTGESIPGAVFFVFGLGALSYSLMNLKRPHENELINTCFILFGSMAMVQARFIWLLAPFAAVIVSDLAGDWLVEKKVGAAVLGFLVAFGLIFGNVGVYTEAPTAQQMIDVQEVARITQQDAISNDWHYGHWLRYFGANATYSNLQPQSFHAKPGDEKWLLVSHFSPYASELPLYRNFSSFQLLVVPR